jgi:hypothetical protein
LGLELSQKKIRRVVQEFVHKRYHVEVQSTIVYSAGWVLLLLLLLLLLLTYGPRLPSQDVPEGLVLHGLPDAMRAKDCVHTLMTYQNNTSEMDNLLLAYTLPAMDDYRLSLSYRLVLLWKTHIPFIDWKPMRMLLGLQDADVRIEEIAGFEDTLRLKTLHQDYKVPTQLVTRQGRSYAQTLAGTATVETAATTTVTKKGFTQEAIVDLIVNTVRSMDAKDKQETKKDIQEIKDMQEGQARQLDQFSLDTQLRYYDHECDELRKLKRDEYGCVDLVAKTDLGTWIKRQYERIATTKSTALTLATKMGVDITARISDF